MKLKQGITTLIVTLLIVFVGFLLAFAIMPLFDGGINAAWQVITSQPKQYYVNEQGMILTFIPFVFFLGLIVAFLEAVNFYQGA